MVIHPVNNVFTIWCKNFPRCAAVAARPTANLFLSFYFDNIETHHAIFDDGFPVRADRADETVAILGDFEQSYFTVIAGVQHPDGVSIVQESFLPIR